MRSHVLHHPKRSSARNLATNRALSRRERNLVHSTRLTELSNSYTRSCSVHSFKSFVQNETCISCTNTSQPDLLQLQYLSEATRLRNTGSSLETEVLSERTRHQEKYPCELRAWQHTSRVLSHQCVGLTAIANAMALGCACHQRPLRTCMLHRGAIPCTEGLCAAQRECVLR